MEHFNDTERIKITVFEKFIQSFINGLPLKIFKCNIIYTKEKILNLVLV